MERNFGYLENGNYFVSLFLVNYEKFNSETLKTKFMFPASIVNIRSIVQSSSRSSDDFLATVAKSYRNLRKLMSRHVLIWIEADKL